MNEYHYLFRSRHYKHGGAYGGSSENGTCATISTVKAFDYGTDHVDNRFKTNFYADTVFVDGKKIYLDNGKPLVYMPMELKLNLSDSPYKQTAGARAGKYEVDRTAYSDGRQVDNDIVLFRYADAILMKAEAKVRNGEDGSKELNAIEFSTQNIDELEKQIKETETNLQHKAKEISESRKNFAQVLSVLIQEKLEKLELPKARFEISVKPKELSSDGIDNVEFLISTNISEEMKPLAKVASGGEISRVMLAIKSIFAQSDDINTVIFDEIDTGISGKASQSVADEIVELSKYHQIIVITHQAIIASKANKHFYVRKSQNDETKVEVYVLTGENRIKALAELAGGEINEQSIEFARSLIG